MCTHTCMPTLFFPFLRQGFALHKSQVPFKAVSEFHPNQKLIFSKRKYSVLMQPSTPGYLACSALSKSSDKGASKRSPAQQQEGAYSCLCSKATVAAAPVSGPRVRELWWNNHTSPGHSTAVHASLMKTFMKALSPGDKLSEQYTLQRLPALSSLSWTLRPFCWRRKLPWEGATSNPSHECSYRQAVQRRKPDYLTGS